MAAGARERGGGANFASSSSSAAVVAAAEAAAAERWRLPPAPALRWEEAECVVVLCGTVVAPAADANDNDDDRDDDDVRAASLAESRCTTEEEVCVATLAGDAGRGDGEGD